jgi:hypothetical protein
MRLRHVVTRIGVAITVACAAIVLLLWLEHRRTVELPVPTGPLPVGRTGVTRMTSACGSGTTAATATTAGAYLPEAIRTEWEHARPWFINFLTADLSKVQAHSAHDVAVSVADARYPVVMLGGGGSGTSGLVSPRWPKISRVMVTSSPALTRPQAGIRNSASAARMKTPARRR